VTATISDALGTRRTLTVATLLGSAQWAPSAPVAVLLNASPLGPQQVSFAFAPADAGGRWTIDDVYVDPYGKG
jgi:hypothetical protein